jgi:hypothetical protein
MLPFAYLPLDPLRQEIRLIRLQPSHFGDDIHVEIFHESLSKEHVLEYEALSYTWGSPQNAHSINISQTPEASVNNQLSAVSVPSSGALKTLAVTKNLWVALRHLRRSDAYRILWIDAICINQQDIPERSAEVGRMGLIYCQAARTIIWLGPASVNSTLAIETLHSLGSGVTYDPINHSSTVVTGSTINKLEMNPDAIATKELEWEAIQGLLYREWFTRLWIYQEIRLSREHAIVVVGFSELPWSTFEAVIWWMIVTLPGIPTLTKVFDMNYIDKHVINVLRLSSAPRSTVFQCIDLTKHASCSDPRDRLYGTLSLHTSAQCKISPDYSKTKEQIYEEFARSSIMNTEDLEILKLCELRSSFHILPSWVPDLSVLRNSEFIHQPPRRAQHRGHFSALGKALHIEGIVVDTIKCLGTPVPNNAKLSEIIAICRTWQNLVDLGGRYINGGTMIDAFVKALICGTVHEDQSPGSGQCPTLEECRSAFLTFVQNGQVSSANTNYRAFMQRKLRGRTFGMTSQGYIGALPGSAQIGDDVCCILGANAHLLLRPVPGRRGYFRLVGECYAAGLMDYEALLGSMPERWRFGETDADGNRIYIYDEKRSTLKDPRLGPLPQGWQIRYSGGQEVDEDGNFNIFWFTNENSGEETHFDPRLTKDALRERGVEMLEFILV